MKISLKNRLFILFISISALAMLSAFIVRGLIVRDFRYYLEGEEEDRIQRIISQFEGSYERDQGWVREKLADDFAWALQSGFETRLYDHSGAELLDTEASISQLTPLMRKRLLDTSDYQLMNSTSLFANYPLFLNSREIGHLELRKLNPEKEHYFIKSSEKFLFASTFILAIISLAASYFASRKITAPIAALTKSTKRLASGDKSARAEISRSDEIGSLAESFNSMAERLEAEEKLRRRLMASGAHELRTPLAIISGELEGMIDGILPVTKGALKSMHEESVRLCAILNEMDEMTRAESARLSLEKSRFEIAPLLQGIASQFGKLFEEKKGHLLIDAAEDRIINADPDKIRQIIINLLANALRAIERGGKVTIAVTGDKQATAIEIKDNGCGIAEQELPYIFERFYKGKNGGLGLGLSIVKELVEAHGGSITATSKKGEGSCFRVVIPA